MSAAKNKVNVEFVKPEQLPPSGFAKRSVIGETPEWKAIIEALPKCKRDRILKVLLSDDTIKLTGGKRGDAFNFHLYLLRWLNGNGFEEAKVHTRKEPEGYYIYVERS